MISNEENIMKVDTKGALQLNKNRRTTKLQDFSSTSFFFSSFIKRLLKLYNH